MTLDEHREALRAAAQALDDTGVHGFEFLRRQVDWARALNEWAWAEYQEMSPKKLTALEKHMDAVWVAARALEKIWENPSFDIPKDEQNTYYNFLRTFADWSHAFNGKVLNTFHTEAQQRFRDAVGDKWFEKTTQEIYPHTDWEATEQHVRTRKE